MRVSDPRRKQHPNQQNNIRNLQVQSLKASRKRRPQTGPAEILKLPIIAHGQIGMRTPENMKSLSQLWILLH